MELRHDLDAIAHRFTDLAKRGESNLEILSRQQTAVRALGERVERPDFHRGVALREQALGELVGAMYERYLVVIRPFRLQSGISCGDTATGNGTRVVVVARARVVCADTFTAGAAEQLRDRLIESLPEDVPQSDVDHRGGAYFGAAAREAEVTRHQMAVVRLDLQRILAQQIRRAE